jgi:pilus assembly protein CpaD
MFNQSLRLARYPLGLLLSVALIGCMSARPPLGLPDARVVTFDGENAHGPDCRSLALPSTLRDPDLLGHPSIPFGCANYSNLAAQLARPSDIAQPAPYAGADGSVAARSVQRYDNPPAPQSKSQDNAPATSSVNQ